MPQAQSVHNSLAFLVESGVPGVLEAMADILILVDSNGMVVDVECASTNAPQEQVRRWIGKPIQETVTSECYGKIADLCDVAHHSSKPAVRSKAVRTGNGKKLRGQEKDDLRDMVAAGSDQSPDLARQVNHALDDDAQWPVIYRSLPVDNDGSHLLFGRDVDAIASLQQQLIRFQASMEEDYAKRRGLETRYRVIFETSDDAFLLIDASSLKIVEANSRANALFRNGSRRLVGRTIVDLVASDFVGHFVDAISAARATGKGQVLSAQLKSGTKSHDLALSPFRQDDKSYLMVRVASSSSSQSSSSQAGDSFLLKDLIERTPDGFVVTDHEGVIVSANRAFLNLADLTSADQAVGQTLGNWLGRPGVDLEVMLGQLRSHGFVRLYATSLKSMYGTVIDVEVAANTGSSNGSGHFAFALRDVNNRLRDERGVGNLLPHSADELSELIGRVPLKELVRQTTDVIERLCIETALELTAENRASAAELLGLSRQGLYMKLRRYGLIDGNAGDEV